MLLEGTVGVVEFLVNEESNRSPGLKGFIAQRTLRSRLAVGYNCTFARSGEHAQWEYVGIGPKAGGRSASRRPSTFTPLQ